MTSLMWWWSMWTTRTPSAASRRRDLRPGDRNDQLGPRADPERAKIATLTVRERQAIAVLASDAAATGKIIARRLCISEHTLRNHLSSIYSKLDVANRVELYAYATRHRLDKAA